MRFIVDESTGAVAARWLESVGHDVLVISEDHPRMADEDILALVFREGRPHRGVILLRLADDRKIAKIAALERFLADVPNDMPSCFVVVTERGMRVTRGDG